jgi:hypothetical protein
MPASKLQVVIAGFFYELSMPFLAFLVKHDLNFMLIDNGVLCANGQGHVV